MRGAGRGAGRGGGNTVGRKRVEKEINNRGGSHDGCGREAGIEGMENLT